jgi:outer membrane protein
MTRSTTNPLSQADSTSRRALASLLASASLMLALGGSGQAHAQSLLELFRAADAADPAAAGARAQQQVMQHRMEQARAAYGVTANLTYNNSHSQYAEPTSAIAPDPRTFTSRQATLQFTQPIYKPSLRPQLLQAKAQGEQARLQGEQVRIDFMLRFVESVFDMLKARDVLRYLQVERTSIAAQMAQARRSFSVGTVAVTDVREVQAKADLVAAQVAAAEFDLALRHQTVLDLVGRPAPELLARGLEAQNLPALDASGVSAWMAEAHNASPSLRQAQWALEVARQETTKATMAHAPTVEANYNYTRTWDSGSVTSVDRRLAKQFQVGVVVNVPLFASGATSSKQRESVAAQDKAQADLDIARRNLAASIRQSFSAALSAVSQALGLATAVQSQSVAVRASQRAYEVGLKANAEVLAAQSKLSEAQRDLSKARYDAWLAFLKLKGAAGQLDEYDLSQLDGMLTPLDQPLELSDAILAPIELPQLKLRRLGVEHAQDRELR